MKNMVFVLLILVSELAMATNLRGRVDIRHH